MPVITKMIKEKLLNEGLKDDEKKKLEADFDIVESVKDLPQELYSTQKEKVQIMTDLIETYGNLDDVYTDVISKETLKLH